MSDLNAVFYLSLSTLVCGGIGLLLKTLYKIKCSEIKCCGCINIKRDIEEEIKYDTDLNERTPRQPRSSITLGFVCTLLLNGILQ